jgi:hypothetical protein
VGSTPLAEGTKTRFSLLIGLPIALMMLSTIRLLLDSDRKAPGFMLATFWIMAFGVATVGYYVEWQARWVHDRSVMTNLARLDAPEDVSVIWVDDQYRLGPDEYYRVYEWSSIFDEAWRDASRIGLAVGEPTNVYEPQRYDNYDVLSDFDASRCQAVLTIQKGPRPEAYNDALGLSARYLVFRYLLPGQLDSYLSDVTRLEFRRILAPQAINCAAQQAFMEQSPFLNTDEAYILHTNRVADVVRLERAALDAGFFASEQIAALDALPLEPTTLDALTALGFDPAFYQLYRTFTADSALMTNDELAATINESGEE